MSPPLWEASREKEAEYRVKYDGYREDRLKGRLNKETGKKSADISGFSYVHTFSYDELGKLIQIVCFSDMLDCDEKERLVEFPCIGRAGVYDYFHKLQDGIFEVCGCRL